MNDCSHFSKDTNRWEQATKATWRSHDICPLLTQFYTTAITWWCLSAIFQAKAWGDPKKPKLSMAYLLIVPAQVVEEERKFRLVAIWVHLCQTLLSLLEEAAKKLTLLINTGDNWPYAFVQLCEDSQCIPLSDPGHISIMVDGAPSRSACGHPGSLQASPVWQWGGIPEGLNEDFKLIWVPIPKQSVWDVESTNEPVMLWVNLPRTTHGDVTMAAPQWSLMLISCLHSVTGCPIDTVTRPSMEEEVERTFQNSLVYLFPPGGHHLWYPTLQQLVRRKPLQI